MRRSYRYIVASTTIPFQNGFDYVNQHYASHIKSLCYNYTVNEDKLAYLIIEPTAGSTVTPSQKRIVIINSSDSTPLVDELVSIAGATTASWAKVQTPFAINGFFGYVMPYGTNGSRSQNKIAIFKYNDSTHQLDHVGSSSTYESTLLLTSASFSSARCRTLSCFYWNGKNYWQTSARAYSYMNQVDVVLDNSGSSSTYWSPSKQYTAYVNSSSYGRNSVVINANPSGASLVHFGTVATSSSATTAASLYLHVWRANAIRGSVVHPTGGTYSGSTGVDLTMGTTSTDFLKANAYTSLSNYYTTSTIPYYTGSGSTPIMFGLNTASGFRPFTVMKDNPSQGDYDRVTDLSELLTISSKSVAIAADSHMTFSTTYYNVASAGEFCLPMFVGGTNYRWIVNDTTSRQIVLA